VVDLLWPGADDRRGDRAACGQSPRSNSWLFWFREVVARARGRVTQACEATLACRHAVANLRYAAFKRSFVQDLAKELALLDGSAGPELGRPNYV
jgi:hypothetical protein